MARDQGRASVTDNVDDFLATYDQFTEEGVPHCGLLLASSRKLPRGKHMIGRWCRAIEAYIDRLSPDTTYDHLYDLL